MPAVNALNEAHVIDLIPGYALGSLDALETQRVCDAVLKSAKTQRWEKVAAP